ncbi:MAG: nicotinamide mononucleotide transporter [Gammaproteobacteria bacterium]|nr:MAG: nicotinamide mononucleotide transporter [Gammaproteobacteria bacterium]
MSVIYTLQQAVDTLLATSALELIAVALGLAYLLLAARENIACWYAAFVSTAIYTLLFWDVSLYMESVLQVYYLAMAIYGWWQWRGGNNGSETLPIRSFSALQHGLAIVTVLTAVVITGFLLERHTDAALPYLDAFTTWGAVLTTWMVAKKILENWLYWIVIDSAAIYLYLQRGLALTALLFALYVLLCIFGYIEWQKHYRRQSTGG